MSLNNYKGLIRGAFALTVSYLEATNFTNQTRDNIKVMIETYLKENGLDVKNMNNNGIVTKILRAGESVYFDNKSMDIALERLSRGIKLNLVEKGVK